MVRIALQEDEAHQAQLMQVCIEAAGHECRVFNAGKPFIEALQRDSFDLLVLDWLLPDINGDDVLKWVREHLGWQLPVVFVTQKDSVADVVRGLEPGADDYMAKPVKPLEMLVRITALGRRSQNRVEDSTLSFGNFSVDIVTHTVIRDCVTIEPTHGVDHQGYRLERHDPAESQVS